MPDRTGTQIGRYNLLRFLGAGNFADVYLGQHLMLGSYAAIKILRTNLTPKDINNFLRENRLVASLVHPHIVRVFDCDVEENVPYLVLDYAPGGTIRQKYPRGVALNPEQVLYYLKQIADALQYAHNQKIIHRDIKPENIFLGSKDEILLGDFSSVLVSQSSRLQSQSTQAVVGTAAYIAPEQLQGKPQYASDQYALGIVTYEWLTGQRPFTGTFTEIIGQHMTSLPIPLRIKVPDLSPALEQVVLTALEKDPQQRFPNIQAFAKAFTQACQENSHVWSMPPSPRDLSSSTFPSAAKQVRTETRTRVNTPSTSFSHTNISTSSISPSLAARVETAAQTHPSTRSFRILQIYQSHTGRVRSVAWSADSQLLASGGDDASLHLWQARSGQVLASQSGHQGYIRAIAWFPKDMLLASGGQDATVRIWLTNVYNMPEAQHLFQSYQSPGAVAALAWSPTGLLLASCDVQGMDVLIWDVGSRRPFTAYRSQGSKVNTLAWSPDGTRLAAACTDGIIQIWRIGSNERGRVYQSMTTDNLFALAWSPDGEIIASAGNEKIVRIWQLATEQTVAFCIGHQQPVRSLAWSPDSSFLASASSDGTVRIWEALAARNLLTYAEHTDDVATITWSPDGHSLASASFDGTVHVWQPHF